MTLPLPATERWKPLRAGLVDIFHYDAEEFRFHDGRLLLRGNNGTGKSKVLALTLPFLLDGELSPHRVEPDGDRQKRMEWNLLLGGRHPHPERLGYTWLEFGRRDQDGSTEYRTIGCGLKAVKDRGITRHWFFVTDQRVGEDLSLLSTGGVSLTREKLRDALEGHGTVFDRASDYRRAVDTALFGLGEHRYEALINLLIQLRQPQLSKKPDEKMLSRALTEALPPLSPALITTVAEAFRGLDEEREALRALQSAGNAADVFLTHYRRYAMIATKRKAAALRNSHSRYEHLGRDFSRAEEQLAAAKGELAAAAQELTDLGVEKLRLEARQDALRQSPEMRDAQRLKEVGAEASRLARYAADRERDRDGRAAEAERGRRRLEGLKERLEQNERGLASAVDRADETARTSRCSADHGDLVETGDLSSAARTTQERIDRQQQAITELERLHRAVDQAQQLWERARAEVERQFAEIQGATDRIALGETSVTTARTALISAYSRYLTRLSEISVPDPDSVLARLEAWSITADGVNPAASWIDDAARTATGALGRREAELDGRLGTADSLISALREEIEKLESGVVELPPVPHTRDASGRESRSGAPLWKVVDFTEAVSAEHRAGLEAALESAGLLDAWLTPEGTVLSADDEFLLAGPPVTGLSCADVFRPAVDRADPQAAALPDAVIQAVLARIGLDPGASTWVATDGRWANGVLSGSWRKESAAFIGEGAREAARRERIVRLRADLERAIADLAELERAKTRLAESQQRLISEHRDLPPDTPLREAHLKLAGEHERKRELDEAHTAALGVVAERLADANAARSTADEFAGDVGLPHDPAELPGIGTALADYRLALANLWPTAQSVLEARPVVSDAAGELDLLLTHLSELAARAEEARVSATSADEIYRALLETAGAGVDELFRQLREVEEALKRRDANEDKSRRREQAGLLARGNAEGRLGTLESEIRQAVTDRDKAVEDFRAFAVTGVLALALPTMDMPDPTREWPATPAVLLARAANAELDGLDDSDAPWDRSQKKVAEEHKILSDAMSRHGHSVSLTLREGIMIVDVVFQGRARDVPELAAALAEETRHRAHLLSAKEREILENHLLNEVAGTLHELITAAEDEVDAMNGELTARPTSTGMTLRLVWRTAKKAPDGLGRIRGKLRQSIDAWSEVDRTNVGAFLQEQIAREHAENPAAGWTEQLTHALDYRSWHEFSIQRLQDGQWRPASGPASGGERALAASVPLFAAASAYYKTANNPYAPRLVALDEAFAGVDDDSRAKCLGLLATFDMDVVMTSEREWGCYPQVPGLAICQLSRRDDIDAVLVTPWRWDGRERTRTARPDPFATARVPEPPPQQPDLFA